MSVHSPDLREKPLRPLNSFIGTLIETLSSMTAYKNFVDDFPNRCREILKFAGKPALFRGREVTLALMVASAGLVVPYERLKPDGGEIDHPSGDNKKFSAAAEKLRGLLAESFLSSAVWGAPVSTWHSGKLKSVTGDPDSWDGLRKRQPVQSEKTVRNVLRVIRNALAHGNIFTFRDPIEAIIFINANVNDRKDVRDYSFVFVAPTDFQIFLEKWFDFLAQLDIPQTEAFEVLRDAA